MSFSESKFVEYHVAKIEMIVMNYDAETERLN